MNNEKLTWGDFKDRVTNSLLNALQNNRESGDKYQKSFFDARGFPYNPVTGTQYSGVNTIILLDSGFSDLRFITAKQVSDLYKKTDGEIKIMKGSKSSQICYFQPLEVDNKDKKNPEDKDTKIIPIFKYHNVFSFEQIVGPIDEFYPKDEIRLNDNEQNMFVEEVIKAMSKDGLRVRHHDKGEAFYRPSSDEVFLPHIGQFTDTPAYCRTALHEIGHSTGHQNRLNRNQSSGYGSKDYAYEELVAEFYSFFMNLKIGNEHSLLNQKNHASYANGWLDVITSDREKGRDFVMKAITDAHKAFDYVETKVQELQVSKEKKPTVEPKKEEKKVILSM